MMVNMHEWELTERAKKEGAEQKAIETAKNMIKKNIPLETIAECTGLPIEKVQELGKELKDL